MLLSMTSYGKASGPVGNQTLLVEIKTLNSKFFDLRLKVPPSLQDFELDIRKLLSEHLMRGKIEASLSFQHAESADLYSINETVFRQYFHQLSSLSQELSLSGVDFMQSILRLPDVVASSAEAISDDEFEDVARVVDTAIKQLLSHRLSEGASIENDLRSQVHFILGQLSALAEHEQGRIEKVRQRLNGLLDDYLSRDNVDANRFEQEVLFYLEKIDISEEKTRLRQHCEYFVEELDSPDTNKGRKLNFISQEMGREINTLGAKAYSSDIQRHVVLMKDALEKIKEQLANAV